MKIRAFLPVFVLSVVFVLFLAAPAFAQEEVVPEQEEVIEEEVIEEEIIEEEVIEEEIIEEELMEEEIFLEEEEEVIEEEVVEEVVEEIVEEPAEFKPGWMAKAYVSFGMVEPWGSPGTGSRFGWDFAGEGTSDGSGIKLNLGAQLNPGAFFSVPAILNPLSAEVMFGYEGFSSKVLDDEKMTTMSLTLNGRYDLTDLIMQWIGFEYPALGIFGFVGFQVNSHSWESPLYTEIDNAVSFGTNLGIGVKYNLMSMVGKPVEIDLRFTQNNFIIGDDIIATNADGTTGNLFGYTEYKHSINGIVLGIAYPLK